MKRNDRHPYLCTGITAFAVIAASLCLFFTLFHFREVACFLDELGAILRPIFMGAVIAFLLLPVHRNILKFLLAMTSDRKKEDRRNLKNVKRQKCKLIAVVEVLGFLGSPILNMIYPGEVSRDVEICLDILVDKYLPMFQDKQKGE